MKRLESKLEGAGQEVQRGKEETDALMHKAQKLEQVLNVCFFDFEGGVRETCQADCRFASCIHVLIFVCRVADLRSYGTIQRLRQKTYTICDS